MASDGDENKRREAQNDPGQRYYDEQFQSIASSQLNDVEKRGNQIVKDGSVDEREGEGSDQASWKDGYSGGADSGKSKTKLVGRLKKAAPFLGVTGTVAAIGMIVFFLASPSLLIIHMKELFAEKFNTQLASADVRTTRLNMVKVNDQTKGLCGTIITVKCRFATMSERQVKAFTDAKIEVIGEVNGKRIKPTSFKFNNRDILAADFTRTIAQDQDFRNALKKAYNPEFAGFQGKAWSNIAKFMGLTKKAPDLSGANDEERQKKFNDVTTKGSQDSTGGLVKEGDKKPNCTTGGPECTYKDDEAREYNRQAAAAGGPLIEDGKSGAANDKIRNALSGAPLKGVASTFSITGAIDNACTVRNTLAAIGYAAKTVRVVQMARVFMLYSTIADKIKAGDSPDPAQVAFLGSLATTVIKDSTGKTTIGSATDSFGFKYAAFGDSSASPRSMQTANRFLAGGGLVGELSGVSKAVDSVLLGKENARTTCGVLANPVVQGASLLVGVAAMFVPGVNVTTAAIKLGVAVGTGLVINTFLDALPAMLADIIAGTNNQNIVGEEVGNAMASGGGSIMSGLAAQNGNGLLTKQDALAYTSTNAEVKDQYIADALQNSNPLDAANPHSFVGSIATSLLPAQSSENPLTAVGSILSSSVSSVFPKTSAVSKEQEAKALEVCQDPDALEAGYAVDPFCNPIRGVPMKYVDKDPIKIVDELIAAGELSEDGAPQGAYTKFIKKCILSTEPPGYQEGVTFDPAMAKDCIIDTDAKANYYLHWIDRRMEEEMSGENLPDPVDEVPTPEGTEGTGSGGSNLPRPAGAINEDRGWTMPAGSDTSGIPCDSRTVDKGIVTSNRGYRIRMCMLTISTPPNMANGGSTVSSAISSNAMNMFDAARAAGVNIGLSDGFRINKPGYFSRHSTGLAMDIGAPRGQGYTICFNPNDVVNGWGNAANAERQCKAKGGVQYAAYKWLQANAAKYGFYNYEKEPWHWSTSGK